MTPRAKKRASPGSRTGSDSFGQDLALAEMKLDCLRGLGVDAGTLKKKLAQAKNALRTRDYESTAGRLEELLYFFSLVGEELNALLARFQGTKTGEGAARASNKLEDPTLDEIEETIEGAFQKALHSKGLRRMVEVIALEKVRSVLEGDGVPPAWIRKAVDEAMRKKGSRKSNRGKRA